MSVASQSRLTGALTRIRGLTVPTHAEENATMTHAKAGIPMHSRALYPFTFALQSLGTIFGNNLWEQSLGTTLHASSREPLLPSTHAKHSSDWRSCLRVPASAGIGATRPNVLRKYCTIRQHLPVTPSSPYQHLNPAFSPHLNSLFQFYYHNTSSHVVSEGHQLILSRYSSKPSRTLQESYLLHPNLIALF